VIREPGRFHNAGTVQKIGGTGAATFFASFDNSGTVEAQRGMVQFAGGYSNSPSANLAIMLGGATLGSGYGQIQFSSPPTFDGTFSVNTTNGYRPNSGDTFIVLTYPSFNGAFTAMNGLNLGGGLLLWPQFTNTSLILTAVRAPEIISQPQSLTVSLGHPANLHVTATGDEPLAYQWQKNGTNLINGGNSSGATSNQLTLSATAMTDAGIYRVIVTNAYGSVTSEVAAVTIITANSLQPGTWNTRAPISSARDPSVAVVNGTLYAVGGTPGCGCDPTSALEAYDPALNVWSSRAPMPTARAGMGVGALNGLLYTVGGQTGCAAYSAKVEAYNPDSNSWTTKAPLPAPRLAPGVAVVSNTLYAIGGYGNGAVNGTVYVYNALSNSWTSKNPMPTPRTGFACVVWNGLIYTLGGNGNNNAAFRAVEVYDPASDSWTARSPMPTPRGESPAGAVIGGLIYVAGGNSYEAWPYLSSAEAYDPATDTWTNLPSMTTARARLHGAALNDTFYVVGGYNGSCLATVEALSPAVASPPSISQPSRLGNGQFQIVVNGRAGLNYTVQVSTDLSNWSTAYITNAPTDAFIIPLGPATNSRSFYRLLLGP
jgi:N-acetylneuraminic acid mutarotase